jgi:hypothetical protein
LVVLLVVVDVVEVCATVGVEVVFAGFGVDELPQPASATASATAGVRKIEDVRLSNMP